MFTPKLAKLLSAKIEKTVTIFAKQNKKQLAQALAGTSTLAAGRATRGKTKRGRKPAAAAAA